MKRKDFFGAVVGGIAAIALGRKVADAAPVELPITNEVGSVPNTNPATILPAGGPGQVLTVEENYPVWRLVPNYVLKRTETGWITVPTDDQIRTFTTDIAQSCNDEFFTTTSPYVRITIKTNQPPHTLTIPEQFVK